MRFYIQTEPQFMDQSIEEIRFITGLTPMKHDELPDILLLNTDTITETAVLLSLFSETTKLFFIELGKWKFSELDELYDIGLQTTWPNFFSNTMTFAVRPQVDDVELAKKVGKDVGQAVVDSFKQQGYNRPKVNLSDPDIEIYAWLTEKQEIILGLNLCGDELNSDNDILARSILILSQWNRATDLGEIFCGGVSLSAYRLAFNDAQRERVRNRTFIKLPFTDKEKILNLLSKNWRKKTDIEIACYERKERLQIVKEKNPELRKIYLRELETLLTSREPFLVSAPIITIEKKKDQLVLLNNVKNLLEKNATWQTLTIVARKDVFDQVNFGNKVFQKEIIFKGIQTMMVKYIR